MTISHLGKLKRVEVRDFGLSASDFAAWLARKENLLALGESLGIDLELEPQQLPLEPFRSIFCRDSGTDRWVLITCQLEQTHDSDLGQLLTCVSGLETATVVWIATDFTKEHRSALGWLNKKSDEPFLFFGLEVELWQIGDSPAAPKFNIVVKPDGWSPLVAEAAPATDERHRFEPEMAQTPGDRATCGAEATPAPEDHEPLEALALPNSEDRALAVQTMPAIENSEPSEGPMAHSSDNLSRSLVLLEPTSTDEPPRVEAGMDWIPDALATLVAKAKSRVKDSEPSEAPTSDCSLSSIPPASASDEPDLFETRMESDPDDGAPLAVQAVPATEDPEPSEAPMAHSSEDDLSRSQVPESINIDKPARFEAGWIPEGLARLVAQAMSRVGDPEPSEAPTSDCSLSSVPPASAIDEPDLFETRIASIRDDGAPLAVQATPATEDAELSEALTLQNSDDPSPSTAPAAPPADSSKTYETRMRQRAYWSAFDKVLRASDGPVEGGKKPQPQSWMVYSIGRSHFLLNAVTIRAKKQLRAELYISSTRAKAFFYLLKAHKEEIEGGLDYSLDWEDLPAEQDCRISISLNDADPDSETDWPRQHRWLAQRLNDMHRAFSPWVATVDKLAELANGKDVVVKAAKEKGLTAHTFDGRSLPEAAA